MQLISLLILAVLSGCRQPVKTENSEKYFLKISQDGIIYDINPGENKLTLNKSGFDILFILNKFSSGENKTLQFAVDETDAVFNHVKKGTDVSKLPNFEPGSGLAGYASDPYHDMVICNYGHHYIYYEDESDNRADLVDEQPDGSFDLKWPVESVFREKKIFAIAEMPYDVLYCVAFFDRNKNAKLDEGEFATIELDFK